MALRVLVTGGCGFIGRYIVEELVRRGYSVRVVDNLSASGSSELKQTGVEFIQMDLRDRLAVFAAFKGIDICVSLAARSAAIGFFNKHPAEMLDDNVRIISATFDAVRSQGISRMVYISSSCVFDNSPNHIATEAAVDSSPPPPAGYPFSKLIGEHYCKAYLRQYGLPYTIVRPFNVYGPGELPRKSPGDSHVIPDLAAKILKGQNPLEIFGNGQQTRSFTHVKDIASGVVIALESPKAVNEDFNLGYPFEVSILHLAQKLWNISGRTEPFAIKSVGTFEHDVKRRGVDITKARTFLGWEPKIDLDQGLVEFIDWLRKEIMVSREAS